MTTKTVFINWKFKIADFKTVDTTEESKKIIISNLDEQNLETFKDEISKNKSDEIAVFLHIKNNILKDALKIEINQQGKTIRIFEFEHGYSDGAHPIYHNVNNNKKGLLGTSQFDESVWTDPVHKAIKVDNFDFVWNWYWLGYERAKIKLINLLLPLAIDLQGIKDVDDHEKFRYLISVRGLTRGKDADIQKKYIDDIEKDWEAIKSEFAWIAEICGSGCEKEFTDFVEKLKSLTAKNMQTFINQLKSDKPFSLTDWLQTLITKLDRLSEKQKKQVY